MNKGHISSLVTLSILILAVIPYSVCASARTRVLEQQLLELMETIKGQTVAILTNPTSVDGDMKPLYDRISDLRFQYNVSIKCFFAPQHGLRGDRQDGKGDDDYTDSLTGIRVFSLYGVRTAPTPDQLSGVDSLIYDIQDVGARYYTFIWTLTYAIEVCARVDTRVIVFDRPNPLGRSVEGCPLKIEAGLVGRLLPGQPYGITQRYGLTIGQLIGYLRSWLPSFKYTVIKMSQYYELQERDWVMSSPNMPTLGTVGVYAGLGLIEGTSVSEGRGTTKPFQITGNPNVSSQEIVGYFYKWRNQTDYLTAFKLREAYFIPMFSKHQGEVCGGVDIIVTDPSRFKPVTVALHLLKAYQSAIKDGSMKFSTGLDRLFGVLGFHDRIQVNLVQDILDECKTEREIFREASKKAWLYDISTGKQIKQGQGAYLTSAHK